MTDKWEIFKTHPSRAEEPEAEAGPDLNRVSVLSHLADSYHQTIAQISTLQEIADRLSGEIAHLFPTVAGESVEQIDDMHVRVTRTERYQWDKKELEVLFDQGSLPDFVSRSLSIHKRTYDRLPVEEQAKVQHALTKKLNPPKVEVIK